MASNPNGTKSKHEVNLLIRSLRAHHVNSALRRLDAGDGQQFSESTTYDLVDRDKRYPPKRVIGVALEELTGKRHTPSDFIGGDVSVSFRALEDLGFRIVDKSGRTRGSQNTNRQLKYGKPSWQLVLDAVASLGGRASRKAIRDQIIASTPDFNEGNIDPDLSMLSVNSFGRGNFSPNKKPRCTDDGSPYDALYADESGSETEHVLYDSSRHGTWLLAATDDTGLLRPLLLNEMVLDASMQEEQAAAELVGAFNAQDEADARRRVLAAIVRRQGQRQFRCALIEAYKGRCAITGCTVVEVLEAAHIKPYLGPQTNRVQNGLLLRADMHTLFDLGLIRIDPVSMAVAVAPRLLGLLPIGIHGAKLNLPERVAEWPDPQALREHGERSIAF